MAVERPDIEAVFHAARQKPPRERAAYLDQACGDDPALRRRVEQFLAAQAEIGGFLESPAPELGATRDLPGVTEHPGTVIGPYKLLEQIGEGGFGVVFLAEQTQPVRRMVALKVLKPGMDTREVVARFEAERQALALMDHPNIAKVLDAGETDSGRPFFAMELVSGVPITAFCDDNKLTPRDRLALFADVCFAVQHAHQKGVIHRDLKPSNVLVTVIDGAPVPKVIDFGVAKALGQSLTDKTLFTGVAQMLGTPLYMSPEQAGTSGLDVDTRTDVYSLGVLLYELLTGTTPFDKDRLRAAGYDEVRRIIREEEPVRPSTRLSTLSLAADTASANRASDRRGLSRLVRGELDWIAMKALEKDRNRRYESVAALAADVERYLRDEPVQACPPSAWYRFRKLARRHRRALIPVSAVALAVLVAVGGLATSTVLIARALRSETEALEREQQEAYYHRIALAHRELSADNLRRARELLIDCPKPRRGWEWDYLNRQCWVEPLIIPDTSEINSLAFSPSGEWIVGACGDGSLKIWDGKTGKLVRKIPDAHDPYASSVAFHPDGKHLASVGGDNLVKVWDLTMGDPLGPVFRGKCDAVGPVGTAYAVAFRPPDGRYLVAGSAGVVNLWDWEHSHSCTRSPGTVGYQSPWRSAATGGVWRRRTGWGT